MPSAGACRMDFRWRHDQPAKPPKCRRPLALQAVPEIPAIGGICIDTREPACRRLPTLQREGRADRETETRGISKNYRRRISTSTRTIASMDGRRQPPGIMVDCLAYPRPWMGSAMTQQPKPYSAWWNKPSVGVKSSEKRCPQCQAVKSLLAFRCIARNRDGRDTYCRNCRNARQEVAS